MRKRLQGFLDICPLVAALAMALTAGAAAQSIKLPSTVGPAPIAPIAPIQPPRLTAPSLVPSLTPNLAPKLTPSQIPQAPPLAAPAPVAPSAAAPVVVKFRCEVVPQDQACRADGGTPDGGGGDAECSCASDYCYWNDQGRHVCEKR
jgi:hypothetical protein